MTTFFRHVVASAIVLASAMPVAAQSANRTANGPANRPQPASVASEELASTAKCRQHCGALSASAPHQPQRSITENQAKAAACLRTMAR